MTIPQLRLEQDPADPEHLVFVFEPAPDTWTFDEQLGSRDDLRDQLKAQVALFQDTAPADQRFDEGALQTLRTNVRHLLLQWIGFRGLRVPAG